MFTTPFFSISPLRPSLRVAGPGLLLTLLVACSTATSPRHSHLPKTSTAVSSRVYTPAPVAAPGNSEVSKPLIQPPGSVTPLVAIPGGPAYAQPRRVVLRDGRQIPAVRRLLDRADLRHRQHRWDLEAHDLEQALRMAPQSAWVDYDLARLRMAEHRLVSAENWARRGLLYARDAGLRARLWHLLATIQRVEGHINEARQSEARAGH